MPYNVNANSILAQNFGSFGAIFEHLETYEFFYVISALEKLEGPLSTSKLVKNKI